MGRWRRSYSDSLAAWTDMTKALRITVVASFLFILGRVAVGDEVLGEEGEVVAAGEVGFPAAYDFGFDGDLHERDAEEQLWIFQRVVLLSDEIVQADGLPALGLWRGADEFGLVFP